MTKKGEDLLIRLVLSDMLARASRSGYLPEILNNHGYPYQRLLSATLARLKADGLVTQPHPKHKHWLMLTGKGAALAAESEAPTAPPFPREPAARALGARRPPVSAAPARPSATTAAWVAGGVSLLLALYAIIQAAELDAVKTQLRAQQQAEAAPKKVRR